EIMRDSRVGSFGVAALGLMLLVQWSALLDLDKPARAGGLVLALCLSRWCMAAAIRMFPYARRQGAGTPFHSGPFTLPVLGAAAIVAGGSVLLFGLGGFVLFVIVTAAALVFGRFISSRIGGLTGDTYGAICEVMTALALLALVAGVDKGWMEPLWWHG
ncbi:MAG: adenosylcobinamide-GDP ribazoletransferase, partial [Chloroflexi bacterium]|nr:adenosylcobinamide-GDP ribazoletransferase [Chloroflexota bacterium]